MSEQSPEDDPKEGPKEGTEQEFWDRADAVIATANMQCEEATVGTVSSSTLYAAARFNAFNVARSSSNATEMAAERDSAVEYFTEQYRKMLEDNLDDYIENFAHYMSSDSE